MNKENCALKLVNEIILYYDARSKKHQTTNYMFSFSEILWLHSFFSLLWFVGSGVIKFPMSFCGASYQYLLTMGLSWVALRAGEHFLSEKHVCVSVCVCVCVCASFPPNTADNDVV